VARVAVRCVGDYFARGGASARDGATWRDTRPARAANEPNAAAVGRRIGRDDLSRAPRARTVSATRTQSLRAKVVGPDGGPVQKARVSGKGAEAVTDKAGIAHLTSLPGYGIRIEVHAANYAPPVPVEVVPRGQGIVLRCRVGVVVRGSVITSGTTPAAGARLVVLVGEEEFGTTSGEGGRFELIIPAGAESVGLIAISGDERAYVKQHRLDGGEPVLRLQPTDK